MARVTVEDCLDKVDNRFELVLLATKRARQLANGKEAQIEWENDKPTVVALREISQGLVDRSILDEVPEAEAGIESLILDDEIKLETTQVAEEVSAAPSEEGDAG